MMKQSLNNQSKGIIDQGGNVEWKKLMMDMKRLQEKKIALEDQGLQKDLVQGMALQKKLEEEESAYLNSAAEQKFLKVNREKALRVQDTF